MGATFRGRVRWLIAGLAAALVVVVLMLLLRGSADTARPQDSISAAGNGEAIGELAEPIQIDVALASVAAVEVRIGSDGGSLSTVSPDGTRYELSIPAGALVGDVLVVATPLASISGSVFDADFVGGIHFAPEGYLFLKPAVLTITLPSEIDELFGFGYEGTGQNLATVLLTRDGASASTEIWHFSGVGVASGSPPVFPPSSAEVALNQQIAALVNSGAPGQLEILMDKRWEDYVKPVLEAALTNPHEVMTGQPSPLVTGAVTRAQAAVNKDRQWHQDAAALGIEVPPVSSLGQSVVEAARTTAFQFCSGSEVAGYDLAASIARFFAYIKGWEQIAHDNLLSETPADVALGRCAEVSISESEVPEWVAAGGSDEAKFRVGVRFKGSGGSTRYDLRSISQAPVLRVDVVGGEVASGSSLAPLYFVDGDGWATLTITKESGDDMELTVEAQWASESWGDIGIDAFHSVYQVFTIRTKNRVSLKVRLEPPAAAGAYSDSVAIEPGERALIQATVFLEALPSSGRTVTFTIDDGAGSLGQPEVTTGPDGIAPVTFTAPDEPGQSTVIASHTTAAGKLLSDTITISYGASVAITPSVKVTPAAALVNSGGTVDFTATTESLTPSKVTWSTTGGSVQSTGDLTATWTAPAGEGTFTVTARSVANSAVRASVDVIVELSEETAGEFSEGFYYGRQLYFCEFRPDPGEQCAAVPVKAWPAWMHIHRVDGTLVVDFYYDARPACGWMGRVTFPGVGVVTDIADLTNFSTVDSDIGRWQTLVCPGYPDLRYRAYYNRFIQLEVGSTGSTTTLLGVGEGLKNWSAVCYIECLSSGARRASIGHFRTASEIRFGTSTITLIGNMHLSGDELRWIFVKRPEQDPFGTWGFDPESLETPEEFRR